MSDYRLVSTDIGWIVYAGEEPLLLISEESLALQIVSDADALLQVHQARVTLESLGPPVPSPNLQAEAPLTAPSQNGESRPRRSRPRNPDDASPRQS